jgi:hypothetical protein
MDIISVEYVEAAVMNDHSNRSAMEIPEHQLHRLRFLEAKLEAETFTEPEREELLRLVEMAETADVERVAALFALAQERQITLGQLMLEIQWDDWRSRNEPIGDITG